MFDFIERLRQKSDGSKKKIAFLTSFSLAGLIFVVWLSVIYPDFSFKEKQKQTATAHDTGVFSSFLANMSEGFKGVKDQFNAAKEAVSSLSTSTHYRTETDTTEADFYTETATTSEEVNPGL